MKFRNTVLKYGAVLTGSLVAASAFAVDESGITTAETLAVIADGRTKLIVIALAAAGALIALKWVKRVRSAA